MHPAPRPSVSVLLPAFNASQTLAQSLDSLLRQRFQTFEVVAVDDGSEDATCSLLEDYARRDPRIRIFCPGKQGLVGTLNTALALARGRYIARMDADDVAHPDRIGLQQSFLEQHTDVAVVGSLVRCFPRQAVGEGYRVYEDWLNSLIAPEDIAREIFIESALVHPSVMMRRTDLEAAGGYLDPGWAEDYDLWLRLHLAGKRFAKVPRLLHFWRERPDRLTRRDSRYSVENFLRAKAHYLALGPLASDRRALIWGAGQIGRRLSKHLQRAGIDLVAFVDIDPGKIGSTRRGAPIIGPQDLPELWNGSARPLVLAAVPSRGARGLIRGHLNGMGFKEGTDFLCVA